MQHTFVHSIFDTYFDALPLSPKSSEERGKTVNNEGYFNRVVPRPGLELVESCYHLRENRSVSIQSEAAMVELSFSFQGSGEVAVAGNGQHELLPDSCALQLMRNFQADFYYRADTPLRSIAIGISVEQFNAWLAETNEGAHFSFDGLLGTDAFRMFRMPIRPELSRLLPQIDDTSPSHPALRRLHMEGRILEIAALALDTFLFGRDPNHQKSAISRSDREKIRKAREILLAHMEAPPSLIELSRMAGVNEYKLKVGFKEEFGTSVFAYLREKRLERALTLLRDESLSVSQTAAAVGFSNFSHFAEAFRKQYGLNPSDVKRRR